MADAHTKIIANTARSVLADIGFKRKGQSRLWTSDQGEWLNVIEFTPSRWTKGVHLTNAAHFFWTGVEFLSFNETIRSDLHAEFENEDQFQTAMIEIAAEARDKAQLLAANFGSFDKIAAFFIQRAETSPERMAPSWWGYEAAIASHLLGNLHDADSWFSGITDERVVRRAQTITPLIGDTDAFRAKINEFVAQGRERQKLPPLEGEMF